MLIKMMIMLMMRIEIQRSRIVLVMRSVTIFTITE